MRVLLLEDDERTARAIANGLTDSGYEVVLADDVETAGQALRHAPIDAAILDVMVPGGSGYDVLQRIRRDCAHTPVLILTARDSVADRVEGLESGADDYLVKPFAFAELLARLRALSRRAGTRRETYRVRDLQVDVAQRIATLAGHAIDLTQTEFNLLLVLVQHRGEVLNRNLLLELVWGYRFDPSTNLVDVHINRLRRKLEAASANDVIRTVRGVGYVVA